MMDFGLIGMEGLVGQQESGSPDPDGKRKCTGSGFVKQERSGSPEEEDPNSRAPKVPRNCHDLGLSLQQQEMMLMRSGDCRPPPQSQMLSFASPTSEVSFLSTNKDDKASQSLPLSYYHHSPAPVYSRNAGYGSGSMHGSLSGIRGAFTPAQWIELEHQALIYKYLTANVPVPATLLIPIRKALNPSGFSGFSTGSFPAHSYGWGPFHLGYSGSTDPEPGRCRRTDGKKWRCSRDAVPDQKYCERHINRGRHRSRKPVEGQTGQAASGPTNPIPKVGPTSSATSSAVASSGGSVSNSLAIASHQLKSLQAGAPDPVVNRFQDPQGLSMMPKGSPFSIPEQHNPYKSTQPEFGFVSTDALLNPLPKNPYLNCTKNYNNSFLDFNNDYHQTQEQQSNRSVNPWSEELNSDWTQLSMSIPMSELSSSSPNQEKLAPSPLRLSHENTLNETGTKNGNWIPISWGNSMGGPLGEVLNSKGNGSPPQMDSSPTGVLQKGAFVSPPDENRKTTQEAAARLGDELLGSAHVASSIPAL